MSHEKRPPKSTEEVVEFFLSSVVVRMPEKLPPQQYRQRELHSEVIGYNRAQEDLRHFLAQIVGDTKTAERGRKLADERHEEQTQPMDIGGGIRCWPGWSG